MFEWKVIGVRVLGRVRKMILTGLLKSDGHCLVTGMAKESVKERTTCAFQQLKTGLTLNHIGAIVQQIDNFRSLLSLLFIPDMLLDLPIPYSFWTSEVRYLSTKIYGSV